ncbi:MAG: VOC family protein [Candidatus Azotimanducaceae bacterium WSBS_2022_MAG_OTU7]
MTPFNIEGIDHLVLRVSNLAESRKFYEGLLGCVMERELPDLGLFQLRAGKQLIDLVPIGSQLGGVCEVVQENRNQDHFCLTISPFEPDVITEMMVAAGVICSEVGTRYGADGYGLSVYVTDPDGNTVELKEAG